MLYSAKGVPQKSGSRSDTYAFFKDDILFSNALVESFSGRMRDDDGDSNQAPRIVSFATLAVSSWTRIGNG
jgi:hypothetical protein